MLDTLNTTALPVINRHRPWLYVLLIVVLSYIPLFYNLGGPVLMIWDESRNAVNAWEMSHGGKLLIPSFDGDPDLWNTKPPLLQWTQILSMKIFGENEWAIRFPSALAGLLTGLLILWFTHYLLNSYILGFIAVLVLFTSNGFVNAHSVRTGDFDALLVLFSTAGAFLFYLALEEEEPKKKSGFILGFFIFLTLAALTKSIAAFLLGPAYLVYLVYRRQLIVWLRNRNFWMGASILVIVVFGYYLIRNFLNPGYIGAVIENEISGRYLDTQELNKAPFSYYFRLLYQMRFQNWYYLLPLGLALGYLSKDGKLKRLISYLLLLALSYLVIISISETKLAWYDLPVFPFLTIIVAVFFAVVFRIIQTTEYFPHKLYRTFIPILILLFFFARPYFNVFKRNHADSFPYQDYETHSINHLLRNTLEGKSELNQHETILYEGDFQHFLFYVYRLQERGYEINLKEKAVPGSDQSYIVYQDKVLYELSSSFRVEKEELIAGVYSVEIK
jgi:4-amino-4-deoxy-L-arabinose transferase-like glycosyltransferase